MVCICFYLLFFSHFPPQNRICTYSQHSKNLILLMQVWIFQCQNEKLLKLIFFCECSLSRGRVLWKLSIVYIDKQKKEYTLQKFFLSNVALLVYCTNIAGKWAILYLQNTLEKTYKREIVENFVYMKKYIKAQSKSSKKMWRL